ncbi:Lysophosphatidylserine lipase ABHD12 like protein [Verticillium longisporum]|nr:Lysophosphatidylserine lipase ABHD12 like protein [Verticillium longisporum]
MYFRYGNSHGNENPLKLTGEGEIPTGYVQPGEQQCGEAEAVFLGTVIYLNRVTLTWFQDVAIPEQWGFLHNQVTPFTLDTPHGETLHAWHILPLGLYQKHEQRLVGEPSGIAPDISKTLGFELLRDDPDARLVIYLHGAAGTLGSGWRPASYRAIYAASPRNIHTVAIDYRGFGASTGTPSEEGLLTDALTLVNWALKEARIPPSRIVIFGQSLGIAVGIALTEYLAALPQPILLSGMVLVAPFADVELLTATYRVAGTIPLLDPLAHFPRLLALLNTFILSKWPSKDKLASFIRRAESLPDDGARYHINIFHAEDDYDVPWSHSEQVFWHAANAATPMGINYEDVEKEKESNKQHLGAGGWVATKQGKRGLIREEIVKWGLHDKVMSYPVVSLAILRAFEAVEAGK